MFTVNGVKVRVIIKNIGVIPRRILGKWFWLDEVEIEQKIEDGKWVDIRFFGEFEDWPPRNSDEWLGL